MKIKLKIYRAPLINEEVARENILSVRSFLEQTFVDDQVILFVAGHGLVDDNLDYYYGTYDVDFNHPTERGLSYIDLENLLKSFLLH